MYVSSVWPWSQVEGHKMSFYAVMSSFYDNIQADVVEAFNSTSRYLDD